MVKPALLAAFDIASKQIEISNIMPHSVYMRQELPQDLKWVLFPQALYFLRAHFTTLCSVFYSTLRRGGAVACES